MDQALINGITLGLALGLSVSPILFSIIKQSINNGIRGGLAFVIGVSFSDATLAVVSNVFTELFTGLTARKAEIGIIGSTFLISVGIYFIFFKKVKINEAGKQIISFRKRDYIKIFLAGFFMNTLNPFIFLLWLTMTTGFAAYTLNDRITTFTTALIIVFAFDLAKVFLANKIRQRLTHKNIVLLNRINGVILIGFGIALIVGLLFFSNRLPSS
jgi:threonine/homoserine/homoserine lactone efflux protein